MPIEVDRGSMKASFAMRYKGSQRAVGKRSQYIRQLSLNLCMNSSVGSIGILGKTARADFGRVAQRGSSRANSLINFHHRGRITMSANRILTNYCC